MVQEKRGTTSTSDVRELVKMAQDRQATLAVRFRLVGGGEKRALVIVATGKRAALLERLVAEFAEDAP